LENVAAAAASDCLYITKALTADDPACLTAADVPSPPVAEIVVVIVLIAVDARANINVDVLGHGRGTAGERQCEEQAGCKR
jgi:hypothetical protein